jgi:hypothetical protein
VTVFCVEQLRRLPCEVDVPMHMVNRAIIALSVEAERRKPGGS